MVVETSSQRQVLGLISSLSSGQHVIKVNSVSHKLFRQCVSLPLSMVVSTHPFLKGLKENITLCLLGTHTLIVAWQVLLTTYHGPHSSQHCIMVIVTWSILQIDLWKGSIMIYPLTIVYYLLEAKITNCNFCLTKTTLNCLKKQGNLYSSGLFKDNHSLAASAAFVKTDPYDKRNQTLEKRR